MHPGNEATNNTELRSVASSHIAIARLSVGLIQGFMLYFLYHAAKTQTWPATDAQLFAPWLLVFSFVPVLLISSLGHLPPKILWRWMLVATVILACLGFYDIWRSIGAPPAWGNGGDGAKALYSSWLLWVFGAGGFYIAHALIMAAAIDQRGIAHYPTYFDSAWKLLIQIQFSCLFVGAFWLVLWLGAALFKLIELDFLLNLLKETWFSIPITVFAFACAMHLTDMRPAIVRGIRNLLLVLLSWILPITVLIVGGFLLSLPFTGLAHLWATKHATALLLSAVAVLIILINTAFQNGMITNEVAQILRLSARLACFLLLPLAAIAIYALILRVGDYSWTTDRIIAACCLLVASCYSLGYAWAAGQRAGWLDAVASVNIGTAFVILAVLLALFSPLLDPARISVAQQIARLESGLQSAAQFDFDYLKFQGKRYGLAALEQLKTSDAGKDAALVREKAAHTLEKKYPWETTEFMLTAQDLRSSFKVWPATTNLPESFLTQDWGKFTDKWRLPTCLKKKAAICDVYPIDFDGDNKAELLLIEQGKTSFQALLFAQAPDTSWTIAATLPYDFAKCALLREKLQLGEYKLVTPRLKDIEIAGSRIKLNTSNEPQTNCESTKK